MAEAEVVGEAVGEADRAGIRGMWRKCPTPSSTCRSTLWGLLHTRTRKRQEDSLVPRMAAAVVAHSETAIVAAAVVVPAANVVATVADAAAAAAGAAVEVSHEESAG